MAWQPTAPQETLDFAQIIFKGINSCRESANPTEFQKNVEVLYDLLWTYQDDTFREREPDIQLRPDMSKPYRRTVSLKAQRDYSRRMFRELVSLVHRCGFLPEKSIEGVLDEETIDAILKSTSSKKKEEPEAEEPSDIYIL